MCIDQSYCYLSHKYHWQSFYSHALMLNPVKTAAVIMSVAVAVGRVSGNRRRWHSHPVQGRGQATRCYAGFDFVF